jgi:glycosyltransferase involved in cell wall biosynthesis
MISVIVPVYNGEKTIAACLEALLNQTKKPDEIIVVDDGSTDKTKEIVEKFKAVRLIEQAHRGPAAARNLGAKNAKGDMLFFIDADCRADANWVLEMGRSFEDKTISGVQGRYKTEQKGLVARFVQLEIEDRYDRMKKHGRIDFIGSYSAGYRKEAFARCGGFDESFTTASGEDPELSFKLSRSGHKMVFNDSAIVYHNHAASLGAYLRQKFWRAYWRVLLYRKHPSKMAHESYTPQAVKVQILALCSFALFFILSFFLQYALYLSILSLLFLAVFTLPLSFKNFRKDKTVAVSTPVISIFRTIVFTLGLICGAIRL